MAKQRRRPVNPPRQIPIATVRDEVNSAHAEAGLADPAQEGNGTPGAFTTDELSQLWAKVKQLGEEAARKHDAATDALKKAETEGAKAVETLETVHAAELRIKEREAELAERERAAAEREEQNAGTHRDLEKRELEARSGFARANSEALAVLHDEKKRLTTEIAELEKECINRKESMLSELDRLRREKLAELERSLTDQRNDLVARERDLLEREQQLEKDRWLVQQEQAQLGTQRELFREEANNAVAADQDALRRESGRIRGELERVTAERDELEQFVAARRRADQQLGDRSPEEIAEQMRFLEAEVDRLHEELLRRPSEDLGELLERTKEQRDDALSELRLARRDADEYKARLDTMHLSRFELENVRNERDVLRQSHESYRSLLEEQKAEWARLVEGHEARPVFELMTAMDNDLSLQHAPAVETPRSLRKLITEIRHRIGTQGLYYSERDLRLFVGGLAMSRLALLEGISGTGKTSLPREFAKAVLAGWKIVEVQAAWRDHHDLQGHYNTFERRYEETPFVQALYEAQCPEYEDRPYIVILDEMNLSHPEQYFNDLLIGLVNPPAILTLLNQTVAGPPKHLLEGRKLIVPDNVWFVGTANQDETTFGFADKTYDRAHIHELPPNPEPFDVPSGLEHRKPISAEALKALFADAQSTREHEAQRAVSWLKGMRPICQERFSVGWGPRLEMHLEAFAPVVIEAGGDAGEAVDHLVSSQILRKIRGRHDIRSEDLTALRDWIEEQWPRLESSAAPTTMFRIIDDEMRRPGGLL